jgi:uridine kinase
MKEPYVVGVTGGSGAGKTQFLNWIKNSFSPNQLCLISQDNYYQNRTTDSAEENRIKNFDEPNVIEVDQFANDLQQLKKGIKITRHEYTFNNPTKSPKLLKFNPAPIVIVEGIFVFHFAEISKLLNLKIYIEAKEHLKFHRRIARDQLERGYPLEDILYKYTHHVAPAFEKYIEPYRHEADLIIPNNKIYEHDKMPAAVEVLIAYLKSIIK